MKYYADIVTEGIDTIDDIIEDIEKFSSLSEPDIIGVVRAFIYSVEKRLANSRIVQLDRLATFYPFIHSIGSDTKEEVNESNIISTDVRIVPGKKMLKSLNKVPYTKATKVTYFRKTKTLVLLYLINKLLN